MGRRILVTGGAGFIGSNFINYWHQQYPEDWIINLDKLTYAGNLDNLIDVQLETHHHFVKGDICDKSIIGKIMVAGVDWVINFANEAYFDGKITAPADFLKTNILGLQNLLEYAKAYGIKKFLQISTDEVYSSPEPEGYITETSPSAPSDPYLASKAAADLMVMAYNHTYGLPVLITRGCSNYGPYQSPKKFVPQMITKALADETLSLDNGGLNTRNWVHVRDHCRALDLVLHRGNNGEVYNIGGDNEWTDLALAGIILEQLEKPRSLITFNKERLGVRHRRLVSTRKIESELGWQPEIPFEVGIAETARWFQTHRQWW